jgi:hypothetical protein
MLSLGRPISDWLVMELRYESAQGISLDYLPIEGIIAPSEYGRIMLVAEKMNSRIWFRTPLSSNHHSQPSEQLAEINQCH